MSMPNIFWRIVKLNVKKKKTIPSRPTCSYNNVNMNVTANICTMKTIFLLFNQHEFSETFK